MDDQEENVSGANPTDDGLNSPISSVGNPMNVPILPLADIVVFPFTLSPLVIDGAEAIKMVMKVAEGQRLLALFPVVPTQGPYEDAPPLEESPGSDTSGGVAHSDAPQPDVKGTSKAASAVSDDSKTVEPEVMANEAEDSESGDASETTVMEFRFETVLVGDRTLSKVGVLARIVKLLRFPDNTVRILVRGLRRVEYVETVSATPTIVASVAELPDLKDDGLETVAMARNTQNQFQEIIGMSPNFPEELKVAILNVDDHQRLADLVADTLNISFVEKLGILTAPSLQERFQILTILLNREVEVLHLGHHIHTQVSNALSQSQKEFFLREQLKTIRHELGEDELTPDVASIREKMAKASIPEHVKKVLDKEIARLEVIPQAAAEYHVAFTYIDWLVSTPWTVHTEDRIDIAEAKKVLDADHYGLKDVKERILETLAVLQVKKDRKAPILCFVGPPGVGKTSLGQSIARAMGRKFIRMSLGGVKDEAEIRGHRRTYVGALPGRIIQGMKRAGSCNPVFMLDEIDKVGTDFRGDPASALLEVLDPQQNKAFNDHYLELDYDLSSAMFIATANILDTIPSALLDRMEILRLPGYTPMEKRQISKKYLIPRQLKENGLARPDLSIPIQTVDELIFHYTREAGVRDLERNIGSLCRKVTRKLVEAGTAGDIRPKTTILPKDVASYLGPQKYLMEETDRKPEVGLAMGMAWTSVGGSILPVEVTTVPGKGALLLTGSLGNVMKESAQAAFSHVKSRHSDYHIDRTIFEANDFHVHVPDGATPKDGPSAGITIATALVSHLTSRPVRSQTSMTGEITLRGKVTAVGGIKEKVIGALLAGIHTVLLPKQNQKDLQDIPDEVKEKITFHFIETATDAFDFMLLPRSTTSKNRRNSSSTLKKGTK